MRPGSGGQHAAGVELEGGTLPALWYLANIICQIFTEIFLQKWVVKVCCNLPSE